MTACYSSALPQARLHCLLDAAHAKSVSEMKVFLIVVLSRLFVQVCCLCRLTELQ